MASSSNHPSAGINTKASLFNQRFDMLKMQLVRYDVTHPHASIKEIDAFANELAKTVDDMLHSKDTDAAGITRILDFDIKTTKKELKTKLRTHQEDIRQAAASSKEKTNKKRASGAKRTKLQTTTSLGTYVAAVPEAEAPASSSISGKPSTTTITHRRWKSSSIRTTSGGDGPSSSSAAKRSRTSSEQP